MMEYYLNEYSIRGQFTNTDDFFRSLRDKTIPVLNRVAKEDGSVIIKKDTFWQLEVCNGMKLCQIPLKRNERSGELFALKRRLLNVIQAEPYWNADEVNEIDKIEYEFDKEYNNNFASQNCFTKAIVSEGRIISFEHKEYKCEVLKVIVKSEQKVSECELDNITDIVWWDKVPQIKTWYIDNRYHIEVRAKEFDYHPPHFHVSCGEYNAVYKLADGELYKSGNKKLPPTIAKEIRNLYLDNKDKLIEAWESLHGKIK